MPPKQKVHEHSKYNKKSYKSVTTYMQNIFTTLYKHQNKIDRVNEHSCYASDLNS
ncbi:hypothetical protein MAH1_12460 [Sessilibacter sp. MAH1]